MSGKRPSGYSSGTAPPFTGASIFTCWNDRPQEAQRVIREIDYISLSAFCGKTLTMADAFESMDRMYRMQRYFYDITRKYYLLGRDKLLDEMDVRPDESILEAGCGTARNLIILGRKHPHARLFGLDASSAMLETARAKVDAVGLKNISLKTALADDFTFDGTFGLGERFDKIFFSYSISMIPPWRESIDNAFANLKHGGELFIVDFYDQADLPRSFREFLKWWLSKFHVKFWPDLMPHLRSLEESGVVSLSIEPLFRRYSFIARMKKL